MFDRADIEGDVEFVDPSAVEVNYIIEKFKNKDMKGKGMSPRSAYKEKLKRKEKKRAGNQFLDEDFDESAL